MKTYFRYAWVLMALLTFVGCSSNDPEEINEDTATRIYNELKGTYEGSVRVGNEMRRVTVIVANDEFTVKQLPLQPILERIFTNQGELEEALKSGETSTFTAPILNIGVTTNSSLLTMEPTDLVFTVTVGGVRKQVSALISAYANWVKQWGEMSVQMNVVELFCDGQNYQLNDNHIVYFIDNAQKPE
ncbi:MAG: DUF4840 domain-containing protein [Prevotella sp.]|nr:DUF4840 domain-containing protein [Prevotella sp.]